MASSIPKEILLKGNRIIVGKQARLDRDCREVVDVVVDIIGNPGEHLDFEDMLGTWALIGKMVNERYPGLIPSENREKDAVITNAENFSNVVEKLTAYLTDEGSSRISRTSAAFLDGSSSKVVKAVDVLIGDIKAIDRENPEQWSAANIADLCRPAIAASFKVAYEARTSVHGKKGSAHRARALLLAFHEIPEVRSILRVVLHDRLSLYAKLVDQHLKEVGLDTANRSVDIVVRDLAAMFDGYLNQTLVAVPAEATFVEMSSIFTESVVHFVERNLEVQPA